MDILATIARALEFVGVVFASGAQVVPRAHSGVSRPQRADHMLLGRGL